MNETEKSDRCASRFPSRVRLACGALLLVGAVAGCGLLRLPSSSPKPEVASLRLDTNRVTTMSLNMVQANVMRFADVYVATLAQAADDFCEQATNAEMRLIGLRWKLGQATSAYIDASGPNPLLNALDSLVLVTLARMVVEEYAVPKFGPAALPLLETHLKLETNAWTLAAGFLKPEQQGELKELILEWRRKNPDQRYIGPIRFREFVIALGKMPSSTSTKPTSVFSLLFIDPLAGLDPTAAAIEETRITAERAMYYSQRMPMLLSWQTEALVYQLSQQPESKQVLADASRLADAAEAFARTSGQLPQLVNDQRQAAIQQVFDGLNSDANKARDLLTETRSTLNAANETAVSVNAATRSLNDFIHLVSPPVTNSTLVSTNSKPFDVLDYGRAASQIGAAANELNALLAALNRSAPEVARLSGQTSAEAIRVVQYAFRLGLVLLLVFLIGSVLAAVCYRALANRLAPGRQPIPIPSNELSAKQNH